MINKEDFTFTFYVICISHRKDCGHTWYWMSLRGAETSLLWKKEDHNFNIALIISNKTCSECTRGNCSVTFAFWEWAVNLVTAYSSEVAFPRVALYRCFRINNYSSFSKISSAICITRLTTHCTCDLMPVLVICKQRKEYDHAWHQMSSLKLG